jgi:fructose/tagatose bisphosphate aldolase
MADLLALQPNMQIHLHIVVPDEWREKVLREIKHPVFSLLDHGLYEKCTFLSYDSIQSIAREKFLSHMSDTILDEYEEHAEEG